MGSNGGTAWRHGDSWGMKGAKTKEYCTWCHMRRRCLDPKDLNYYGYGAKGITVCDRWLKYENFIADMGRAPSPKHTLDRIDNKGNYEPGNCRWATPAEQARNRKTNLWIEHNGEVHTATDWAKKLNISKTEVSRRYKLGISISENVRKKNII